MRYAIVKSGKFVAYLTDAEFEQRQELQTLGFTLYCLN